MNRILSVIGVAAMAITLAGCKALETQGSPGAKTGAAQVSAAAGVAPAAGVASTPAQKAQSAATAQQQGTPVFFMLAQTEQAPGLRELDLKGATLWYLPQPALERDDLVRVTSLDDQQGHGVVRFDFNSAGTQKLADLSRRFQGKFIVIVIDHDIVAVPRIGGPMDKGAMFVPVSTPAAAEAIVREIAGKHS